jgi:hypothetical protein
MQENSKEIPRKTKGHSEFLKGADIATQHGPRHWTLVLDKVSGETFERHTSCHYPYRDKSYNH